MTDDINTANAVIASDARGELSVLPAKHPVAATNLMYGWLPRLGRNVSMSVGYVEALLLGCAALLLLCSTRGVGLDNPWILVVIFAVYGTAKFFPPTLTLDQDGFSVRWHYGRLTTGTIAWDKVIAVSCRERNQLGKKQSQSVAIDLVLSPSACSPLVLLWAHFVLDRRLDMGELFSAKPARLTISSRRFAKDEDTINALIMLKRYLSAEQLDCSVPTLLERQNECDFTTLWFRQLQTGNESLSPCVKGALLGSQRYEIIERIGSGGQALAYLATERSSGEHVVLKEFVLPIAGGAEITKAAMKHIEDEFRLVSQLDHPCIVKNIDQFCQGRRAYLVMNHVQGESLQKHVESHGAMPEKTVIEIALQICDILEYLHTRMPAVVHRDLTPDNLLLDRSGQIHLIDFNVAKELDSLSASQTVVGKHNYIPPEQFRGEAVPQSDIYAMGATLFWLLTGTEPEPITQAHPKAFRNEVSNALDRAVAEMTEPDVKARFQNIRDVRTAITVMD